MTTLSFNNMQIPNFMYGTAWKKDATKRLVLQAVDAGFRAIDTANQLKHYDEKLVGDALAEVYANGTARASLFLQTKFTSIDGQDHRLPYDASANLTTQVQQSFASSLDHLRTDYLDSYVLHGPYSRNGLGPQDREVWAAIEDLHAQGKTKMIGISNVSAHQLHLLCSEAKTKPMFVQNRCYAVLGWDADVRKICREQNIIYQGFSLLTANTQVMETSEVRSIAKKLGATTAQVIFKFAMQVGMLPLTGTTNAQHMKEDLGAARFELSGEDCDLIESIGSTVRRAW